jgi:hypothetical protein
MARTPGAGRAKGTPNKLTAAMQAFRNLEAERGEIAAGGFGPGDAYRALWFEVAEYRKEIAAESRRRNPSINRTDFLRDKLVGTLAKLLPYERPRLAGTYPRSRAGKGHAQQVACGGDRGGV